MNEIYKGMDNASEKINENFEKIGFELIENENGSCLRYENGYQLCERSLVNLEWKNPMQMSVIWEYPLPFIESPTVIGIKNHSNNPVVRRSSIGVDRRINNSEFILDAQVGETIAESQVSSVNVLAYGKWK